ncbi:XK-related protein 5 [Anthophora quadrimaculata]
MAGKMAAAELKHDNVSCYETVKRNVSAISLHREIECYQFRLLDLFYYLTSVSFFFIDIATDSIIFMEYFLQGQFIWGCFALSSTILPASVIQMFSLRWYHSDGSIKSIHWLLHFLFLGVLHRYLILLCATIYSLRKKRFVKDKNWVYRQESDICMLHLFESFMGAAPQLILQLYVMAVLRRTPLWTSKDNKNSKLT